MSDEHHEKSYRVLEILSESREISQRELARRSGLSLGMVNLIINRLAKTGYIKVSGISRKKAAYILTPAGIVERMFRSYQYFLRACRVFQESRVRLESLLSSVVAGGNRRFAVLGEGDVASLVELILRSRWGTEVSSRRILDAAGAIAGEVVLDCRPGREGEPVGISVMEQILGSPEGRLPSDALSATAAGDGASR